MEKAMGQPPLRERTPSSVGRAFAAAQRLRSERLTDHDAAASSAVSASVSTCRR